MKLNFTKAMAVAIIVGSLLNLINQWEGTSLKMTQ